MTPYLRVREVLREGGDEVRIFERTARSIGDSMPGRVTRLRPVSTRPIGQRVPSRAQILRARRSARPRALPADFPLGAAGLSRRGCSGRNDLS